MVCFKENDYWRNDISFEKDTKNVAWLQVLMKIIVKFRVKNILWTFASCTKHPFEEHEKHEMVIV